MALLLSRLLWLLHLLFHTHCANVHAKLSQVKANST